jgi:hypothetical protein
MNRTLVIIVLLFARLAALHAAGAPSKNRT